MKTTIAILGILLGLTIQSQARTITGDELSGYKRAVEINISSNPNSKCRSVETAVLEKIDYATSVEVTDGAQPLLTFSTYEEGKKQYSLIVLTTDSNYQNIRSMSTRFFQYTSVNDGTLKNPNIQARFLHQSDYDRDCTK